jgi:hypothetical protein
VNSFLFLIFGRRLSALIGMMLFVFQMMVIVVVVLMVLVMLMVLVLLMMLMVLMVLVKTAPKANAKIFTDQT